MLDGVSFTVGRGEFVAVIGPSGCGKSTLFDVVAGLEPPDGGRVLVDGTDVTGRTDAFAYMPQQDLLFPWRTVLDNTTLGLEVAGVRRRAARERARPLFAEFGLDGFEGARPGELSGGMRQRAALLRTVVQERPVLLLDEPFGALDALTRADMQLWLSTVRARFDWTVVLVTHDIREARVPRRPRRRPRPPPDVRAPGGDGRPAATARPVDDHRPGLRRRRGRAAGLPRLPRATARTRRWEVSLPNAAFAALQRHPAAAPTMRTRLPASTTISVRGPCTPSTRSSSMSLVADGPLMNVVGRVGSRRATSSGTVSTTWSARTTHTCTSGTSVIARRPWSGDPSSAIVPVCAHVAADAVTTAANPSRS